MSATPIPIRLQLSTVSGTAPIDANTGSPPASWRGHALAVQIGIFDASNVAADLSNLTSLSVALQASQNAATPLAVVTIPAADMHSDLTISDWRAGTDQQAEADFTPGEMDQSLDGQESADLWLVVTGLTANGQTIIYGAGIFTLQLASNAIPFLPPAGLVSYHSQANATGNSTATPTSQLHTETLAITGAVRTSQIIIGTSNIVAGARMVLRFTGTPVAGITLQIRSAITGGPLITTLVTDGSILQAWMQVFFDGTQWQLIPQNATILIAVSPAPATPDALGVAGQIAIDSDYFYSCVATNSWRRTPLMEGATSSSWT
jgi:hypothetical protein